jgi:hypothetical protein
VAGGLTVHRGQEALADSLISNLGGKVDEGVRAAWESEIGRRIAELDSGNAKTIPWSEGRGRNLAKLFSSPLTWRDKPSSFARMDSRGRLSPHLHICSSAPRHDTFPPPLHPFLPHDNLTTVTKINRN